MNLLAWLQDGGAPSGNYPPSTVLLDLLLSFVLGQWVAWMYGWTHRGLSYSRNLRHSIVLLSMIVAIVMLVVGDSVARAFGLVGALAIVRFRTVVRDARDTTFLFLALSTGIAIGAHHYFVAVVGTLVVTGAAMVLQWSDFGVRHADTGTLRVRGVGTLATALEPVLRDWCRTFEMIALREGGPGGDSEYSYEIRLYHPQERDDLLRAVRSLPGASLATVHIEELAEEW